VLTALGLVAPLPSCEFDPTGLAGSAGVWLVTGVLAMEPLLWLSVAAGDVAGDVVLLCEAELPPSVEAGCCSIATRCGSGSCCGCGGRPSPGAPFGCWSVIGGRSVIGGLWSMVPVEAAP